MQTPEEIRADLPPDLDRDESDALVAIAIRLQAAAPAPSPALRGELRRALLGAPGRGGGEARPQLRITRRGARALAAAYTAAGALLLALAALGLAGAGPFAPS